mgnify:CR=1 FL=1
MFLTLLTFLSAISISVIAAGYSIVGLATLFAGAVVPIIAMGSALEVGKLVAERAKKAGVETIVFDRGRFVYHGRVKALAEAARGEGLNF